jgi:hypothetical protein
MMRLQTSVVRVVLGSIAAAILIVGVVAVVRHDDAAGSGTTAAVLADSGAPNPRSETPRVPGVATDEGAAHDRAEDASTEAHPPTRRATAAPAVVAASDVARPRPGTYAYSWTKRGADDKDSTGTYETVIADVGIADGGYRQSMHAVGTSIRDEVVWSGDGMHVAATVYGSGAREAPCAWTPTYRKLATPLAAGAKWSYKTQCTVSGSEESVTFDQSGSFTVVERTTVQIAGERVDVWKIEGTEETAAPSYSERRQTTAFYAAAYHLTVKMTTSRVATTPWITNPEVTEVEIKNLTPK